MQAWVVPTDAQPASGVPPAIIAFSRFSVPAFVILSGLLIGLRQPQGSTDLGAYLGPRATRSAVPWLVWAPIFLTLNIVLLHQSSEPTAIGSWLAYGAGHLYFLLLIVQFYVLIFIIPRSKAGLGAFTVGTITIQLVLNVAHTSGPSGQGTASFAITFLADEQAPYWPGYCAVGYRIGAEYPTFLRYRHWWPVALEGVAASMMLVMIEGNIVQRD